MSNSKNLPRGFVNAMGKNSIWWKELDKFNKNRSEYCIPRKNSKAYKQIMIEVHKRVKPVKTTATVQVKPSRQKKKNRR
jgi:hypothetical protein